MSVALLFYVLGVSAIGGVIFMVLSVPVGKWTTKKTQAFQKILMKRKDDRMSVVGETMQARGSGVVCRELFDRFGPPVTSNQTYLVHKKCGLYHSLSMQRKVVRARWFVSCSTLKPDTQGPFPNLLLAARVAFFCR